ncbi:MAG: hypothetical protein VX278_05500 [Myxococcota bacterium]|nr:hypothetical protein [Myxococcota bacterium]
MSLFFFACGDSKPKEQKSTKICDLSLDDLNGTQWVYARAVGSAEPEPDVKIRLKFQKKGDKLTAQYNASSPFEMYDYKCISKPTEIKCSTVPKPVDVCLAYLAADKKCTRNAMEKFYARTAGMELELKEIREASIQANEKMNKWKKENYWENQYKKRYSSVGNRLMGILYVKVDRDACNLEITDNFGAISNGDYLEDAAGFVSTNAFLKHTQGELLWEGCTSSQLYDTQMAEFPEDPSTISRKKLHKVGDPINYWLLEEKLRVPEEECSYKYDTWLNMQPLQKDQKPKEIGSKKDKELLWGFAHTFKEPTPVGQSHIIAMVIEKKCGDKPAEKTIACNQVQIAKPKEK